MKQPRGRKNGSSKPVVQEQPDWSALFPMLVEDLSELTQALHGHEGVPGILERLARLEAHEEDRDEKLNAIYEYLILKPAQDAAARKLEPANVADDKAENDKPLTLNSLAGKVFDKVVIPLILMALGYGLFTFAPQLLGLLAKQGP